MPVIEPYVIAFKDSNPDDTDMLGGKGAGLAEMTQEKLPVPPGFTITTKSCKEYFDGTLKIESLMDGVMVEMKALELTTGRTFGDDLLVSVRSGAAVSMPGMMETVLNLGITPATEAPFIAALKTDTRVFLETWKEFICSFGKIACGLATSDRLNKPAEMYSHGPAEQLSDEHYRAMTALCLIRIQKSGSENSHIIANPYRQLRQAIIAVFESWNGPKAKAYRKHHNIPEDLGTAVNIVSMVYGNLNDNSGTGVVFSRNPSTGVDELYGEYLKKAQGEAVVSGSVTPQPLDTFGSGITELRDYVKAMEVKHREVQDVEFTVENGTLFILQRRGAKLTDQAALVVAVDMVEEGLITDQEAATRISRKQLLKLGKPVAHTNGHHPLTTGLPASPGVVSGRIAHDAESFKELVLTGDPVILVRPFTSPEDVPELLNANCVGILTATGGLTSHAAVVARGINKPCVVGASHLQIQPDGTVVVN